MTNPPMPNQTDDELDALLLEVRSDEYGDSGNYNDKKLKVAIHRYAQKMVIEELCDLKKTFKNSSDKSYTGQQIHQVVNERINYAKRSGNSQ